MDRCPGPSEISRFNRLLGIALVIFKACYP